MKRLRPVLALETVWHKTDEELEAAVAKEKAPVICLDERGKQLTSLEVADRLYKKLEEGARNKPEGRSVVTTRFRACIVPNAIACLHFMPAQHAHAHAHRGVAAGLCDWRRGGPAGVHQGVPPIRVLEPEQAHLHAPVGARAADGAALPRDGDPKGVGLSQGVR